MASSSTFGGWTPILLSYPIREVTLAPWLCLLPNIFREIGIFYFPIIVRHIWYSTPIQIVIFKLDVYQQNDSFQRGCEGSSQDALVNTPTNDNKKLGIYHLGVSIITHENHHLYVPHGRVVVSLKLGGQSPHMVANRFGQTPSFLNNCKYKMSHDFLPSIRIWYTSNCLNVAMITRGNIFLGIPSTFLQSLNPNIGWFGTIVDIFSSLR